MHTYVHLIVVAKQRYIKVLLGYEWAPNKKPIVCPAIKNRLLLTLTGGLSSGPRAICLAGPGEVANKFVLRITFQHYYAPVGERISISDSISRYTRIATVSN